ncbi:hypothetical protein DKP76_18275 [Falsochrobactrum shanghaiense]|uniref:Glycosyl transferase n=1 Tax=Falsochrobactrum shanghaiense TaxID=2201899 RepID=A0A316JB99_9HYPH|nr:glycosyltransferase [Falsochrobactrum shanghaiense]PWL16283.1 hypothetical protein DKP76_18275 [Falsochrobactrum shanghaiense]
MKVLIYANVDLNLIDGSTIWVQSIAEVLSGLPNCNVVVLSRTRVEERGVVPALKRIGNVRIVCCPDYAEITEQYPQPGNPQAIEKIIALLDAEEELDRIVVRAPDVALRLARAERMRQRLWAYLLESPPLEIATNRSEIGELVEKAGGLIVQTDTQRGLLEAVFPAACNKTSVLPPMVKPVVVDTTMPPLDDDEQAVRFIYSGKYSITWNVEAFFEIPDVCAQEGLAATVTMIGDKVHNEVSDHGFRSRILEKFTVTPGVKWLGPLEREAAIAEAGRHDLGLCWRTDALDDSLEISTKFLEFAYMGVPAVVNRTAAYESLLGKDYPYFATTMDDVVAAAKCVAADRDRHERIRLQCKEVASKFTYESAAERLKNALRLRKPDLGMVSPAKIKVLVASHDLKFLKGALRWLGESGRYEFLYDNWASSTEHNEKLSKELLAQADVIFCEWCVGAAVWYSKHKLPHQKLFIRLHRYEAFTPFPREVVITAIDGAIVVSEYFRDICINDFDWPKNRLIVLPQYCIAEQFQRSKYPGAERTLGFVGINGFYHKRFDRALNILRLLRHKDSRFRMRIRSVMPWEFDWIWKNNEAERQKFMDTFDSLEKDAELRKAVIFDRPGANMAEWYRQVGFILSTSETEGCHTAVAEGVCSGAMPVVINWPGARSIYGSKNVYDTVEQMADAILSLSAGMPCKEKMMAMQTEATKQFDLARTVNQLDEWFGGEQLTGRVAASK